MNPFQDALHALLSCGDSDTSHFELSVGAESIVWPSTNDPKVGECIIQLKYGGTITLRTGWVAYKNFLVLGISLNLASPDCDTYNVLVINGVGEEMAVKWVGRDKTMLEFRAHFQRATGLDPFLFT